MLHYCAVRPSEEQMTELSPTRTQNIVMKRKKKMKFVRIVTAGRTKIVFVFAKQ